MDKQEVRGFTAYLIVAAKIKHMTDPDTISQMEKC